MAEFREPGVYINVNPPEGFAVPQNLYGFPIIIGIADKGTYEPKVFYNYDDVVAEYGLPSYTNQLPLGLKLAFEGGARAVMGIRVKAAGTTPATATGGPVAAGAIAETPNAFYIASYDEINAQELTRAYVNIKATPASNTAYQNALSMAEDINNTPDIPVVATANSDGTITLTHKIPGAEYSFVIGGDNPGIIGFVAGKYGPGTTETPSSADYITTMQKVKDYPEVDILVPLSTDIDVLSEALQIVQTESSYDNRHEMIAVLGTPYTATVTDAINIANQLRAAITDHHRGVLIYPGRYYKLDEVNNVTMVLDGRFMAAYIAGMLSKYVPSEPLTLKKVGGFRGTDIRLSRSDRLNLAQNGILAIYYEDGLTVFHGHTLRADNDPIYSEISVVRSIDFVARSLRSALRQAYIGRPGTPQILTDIVNTTNILLSSMRANNVIYAFRNVRARFGSDPRTVELKFSLRPIFPVNWIDVNIYLEI